jgi:hypothetical protein
MFAWRLTRRFDAFSLSRREAARIFGLSGDVHVRFAMGRIGEDEAKATLKIMASTD